MPLTPKYSFPYPSSTDLVRDGAQNFEDLADAVETTVEEIDQATTKGDLLVYDGTDYQRLGVGANDTVLLADSVEATGVKWSPISAGGMTLISSGSFTGASLSITSIPAGFNHLFFFGKNMTTLAVASGALRFNGLTTNIHQRQDRSTNLTSNQNGLRNSFGTAVGRTTATTQRTNFVSKIYMYSKLAANQGVIFSETMSCNSPLDGAEFFTAFSKVTTVTSIQVTLGSSTFNNGTFELYGVS